MTGLMVDGSYKQYIVSPERYTTLIPDGVSDYVCNVKLLKECATFTNCIPDV
jgi:D-arabinose 1-dehydrogenase-like Zn-dependent alcohol dehydrogenase